jgi:hypothetical protein
MHNLPGWQLHEKTGLSCPLKKGNMFDLEKEISEWRGQMSRARLSPAAIDELEAHLRDDIQQQIRSGVEIETAFDTAVRRVGQAGALRAEFAKADEANFARPRKWMRIFFVSFAGCFLLWFVLGLARIETSLAYKISGFIAVALNVLILGCIPWFYRWSPVIPDRNTRQWLQAGLTLFCPFFGGLAFRFIVPQLELSLGQLINIILWSTVPVGIFMGIAFGIGDAARRVTPQL